jgi:hypothetical protein
VAVVTRVSGSVVEREPTVEHATGLGAGDADAPRAEERLDHHAEDEQGADGATVRTSETKSAIWVVS